MILVVPFRGHSDYTDALSKAFTKHGGLGNHRLVVVAPTNHLSAAEEFASGLRNQFVAADVVSANPVDASTVMLFREGVLAAANAKISLQEVPNSPVCWLEPGWIPVARDWATSLSSEFYNLGGGAKALAKWVRRPDRRVGNGVAAHTIPGGHEPEGVVVLPAQFIRTCEMIYRINHLTPDWRERLQYVFSHIRADSATLGSLLKVFKAETDEAKSDDPPKPAVRQAAVRPAAKPVTADTP